MPSVLLVDEPSPRGAAIRSGLERAGFAVATAQALGAAPDAPAALAPRESARFAPDVIVLAIAAGDEAAVSRWVTREGAAPPTVVLARHASVLGATEMLRAGVADYLTGDVTADDVVAAVERVIARRAIEAEVERLASRPRGKEAFGGLLRGESPAMRALCEQVARVAASDQTVVITGESGTGKELVARIVHEASRRSAAPFVAINCAAMSEQLAESELFGHARGAFTGATNAHTGLLVHANGGTVLFDEASSMSPGTQARLLRALQERTVRPLGESREVPFDVRVIAATNVDLAEQVALGRFRSDLFYRLNVLTLRMPPLRERGGDVLLLAQSFIEEFAERSHKAVVGLTPGAARALQSHTWPGNVRELRNWISVAIANARHDHVTEQDLPREPFAGLSPADAATATLSLSDLERRHLGEVLRVVGGNKSRAARILGLDRKTLRRKIQEYGLDLPSDEATPEPDEEPEGS